MTGPYALNVSEQDWDKDLSGPFNAVISINMIHIAPFAAAEGLFAGRGALIGGGRQAASLWAVFERRGAYGGVQ